MIARAQRLVAEKVADAIGGWIEESSRRLVDHPARVTTPVWRTVILSLELGPAIRPGER